MSVKNPFQAFFFKWGFIGKIDIPLFLSVNAVTQIWVQKFAEGDRGLRVWETSWSCWSGLQKGFAQVRITSTVNSKIRFKLRVRAAALFWEENKQFIEKESQNKLRKLMK